MKRPHFSRTLGAGIVLVQLVGCQAILDFPDPVDSFRWCIDANPARGTTAFDNFIHNIKINGTWTRGCKCYCPAQSETMLLGESGMLALGSARETWYLNEVATLQAKAQVACTERVAMMQEENNTTYAFDEPGTVSCADAVADESPYFSSGCMLDDDICPGGAGAGAGGGFPGTGGGGETGSATSGADGTATTGADTTGADESGTGGAGGAMLYGLDDWATVLSCPSPDACDVTADFVDDLLQDLSVFEDDAIFIRPYARSSSGNTGFLFKSLGPESLPAAIGFVQDDLIWAVNGIKLTDFAAVGRAFEDLNQSAALTAQFDRDGTEHRLVLRIVPTLDPN